jgi:sugar porter (SP) family MFS transporter
VIAFVSNAALAGVGEHAWRWMLGVMAFPAIAYTLACFTLPESPRWLINKKNDRRRAIEVLQEISPQDTLAEVEATADRIAARSANGAPKDSFWSKRLKVPIILAFLVAFFNQLSGINAILYFAPRIFEMTGLAKQAALLQSIGIGVTNLLFTFVGLWLIDRLGRRTLLYIGSFGYIASLGLVAWAFYSGTYAIVPACIFAFIAAHAIGQGAVIWVFISEIFPNDHRAAGQSLGSFTHWVFAALLTTFFPKMVASFHPGSVFLFFAVMMCLQLLWVKLMVPETKGVALEDVEGKLMIHG